MASLARCCGWCAWGWAGPLALESNSSPGYTKPTFSAWGARIGLPSAEWMLTAGAFFMRTETELILKSRRVVPGRLLKEGFTFSFPEWPAAAADLVRCWRLQG